MSDIEIQDAPGTGEATAEARLVPVLLSISKATRALMRIKLAELGFHNGQDELLLALDEEAPVSVSTLAETLSVRPATVSKMLDRLVQKGMVERIENKSDARRTMVRVMPAGLDARSILLNMRAKLEAELISSFPGDVEAMFEALEVVVTSLKTRLSRLR